MNKYSVWLLSFTDGKGYVLMTCLDTPDRSKWKTWKYYHPELYQAVINAGGMENVRKVMLASGLSKEGAKAVRKAFIHHLNTCAPNGYNRHMSGNHAPRPWACQPVEMLDEAGEVLAWFPSGQAASVVTGASKSGISQTIHGIAKTAGGYRWRKADTTTTAGKPAAFLIESVGEGLDISKNA